MMVAATFALSLTACATSGPTTGAAIDGEASANNSEASASDGECVDGVGPNSSAAEIVNAALAAPLVDPLTGETVTVREDLSQTQFGGAPLPVDYVSSREAEVFSDVAAGGDAAFAAAICDLPDWDRASMNGSYLDQGTGLGLTPHTRETEFGSDPHLIRGLGRNACSWARDIGPTGWQEQIDTLQNDIDIARADPEGHKRAWIEAFATQYSQNGPAVAETLDHLEATPAADFLSEQIVKQQVILMSVEHQCPQLRP